jgi:hypothetical protein
MNISEWAETHLASDLEDFDPAPMTEWVAGHSINVAWEPVDGVWEATIDAHLPVMERAFHLRSTYCSSDPEILFSVARSEIEETSEVIRAGRVDWQTATLAGFLGEV